MNNKLDNLSSFYFDTQLDFDKQLIRFRYESIKEFFRGKVALEMGPAEGVMTEWLHKDFECLDIVDGSSKLLEAIPDYANINKTCSLFEDYKPSRKYDTIIMEHVLEHIEHPVSVLEAVGSWLKPEGVLIIGVPNAKSLHRLVATKMGLLGSEYDLNDRDHQLGHYRVYDLELLKKDVISSNLDVEYEGGVFLKPLSNGQINNNWTKEMIQGFYELGKEFPENSAEIFVVVTRKN